MIAVAGALVLFGFGGLKLIANRGKGASLTGASKVDKNKYQAVFLANDQVYFGKLKDLESQYPVLEDVYYLVTTGAQDNVSSQALGDLEEGASEELSVSPSGSEAGGGFVLMRLGNEVHGPENKLVLNRDNILFVEDLKEDGKLVSAIESAKELEAGENSDQSQ